MQTLHGSDISDIWGYVDETGIEYALIGVNEGGLSVVSLEDPANPREVFYAEGATSIWRDVKTYKDFAFVTNETDGGLQIVNLAPLPENPPSEVFFYDDNNSWGSSHNLFIEEDRGIAYVFGANKGLKPYPTLILDIKDPYNIQEIARIPNFYAHDGIVKDDILYLANVNDGFFSLIDVADPTNPKFISTQTTPRLFTHNLWISDDNNYLFTTDEKSGAYLASYDITDPFNIQELDLIRTLRNPETIIHNTHFLNNYLITSYYRDGVTIHDVSNPANMVEVGHYDTSPLDGDGFNGCWGVYPWLPSGLIIASDIELGLFVLEPDYQRGKELKGKVVNEVSGNPVNDVQVEWKSTQMTEKTSNTGEFITGHVSFGTYTLVFSKPGFETKELVVDFNEDGQEIEVALTPIGDIRLEVQVSGADAEGLEVMLIGGGARSKLVGNALAVFDGLPEGDYQLIVGKWGYLESYTFLDNLTGDRTLHIELEKGYQHTGNLELGVHYYTVGQGSGFVRETPIETKIGFDEIVSPAFDSPNDDGFYCFLTGNETKNPEMNDLDDSATVVFAPMDLNGSEEVAVMFDYYFFEEEAGLGSAKLIFKSGDEELEFPVKLSAGAWQEYRATFSSKALLELISEGNTVLELRVLATEAVKLVDYAIDNIRVVGVQGEVENLGGFEFYPNPAKDKVNITIPGGISGYGSLEIMNDIGQKRSVVLKFVHGKAELDLTGMGAGLYFLTTDGEDVQKLLIEP